MKTILFVDDEQAVRGMAEWILADPEWTVLLARSSDEAFQISRQYRESIDLLITDLRMDPFMNGAELAQCMRQLRPGIRILYVSGFSLEGPALQEVEAGAAGFLPKPFQAAEMRRQALILLAADRA